MKPWYRIVEAPIDHRQQDAIAQAELMKRAGDCFSDRQYLAIEQYCARLPAGSLASLKEAHHVAKEATLAEGGVTSEPAVVD